MRGHLSQSLLELSKQASLAPFLYQTRTLLDLPACASQLLPQPIRHGRGRRQFSTHPASCWGQRTSLLAKKRTASSESTTRSAGEGKKKKDTDSANGVDDGAQPKGLKSYLMRRAIARTRKEKSGLKAVMTNPSLAQEEKQAFLKLLAGLKTRPSETATATTGTETKTKTPSADRPMGGKTGEVAGEETLSRISDIFKDLLKDRRERKRGKSAWDIDEDSVAEPSAPAQATGQSDHADFQIEEIAELVQKGLMPVGRAIDWIVQKESRDVQAALESAVAQGEGDVRMWEICQQRIFSLVRHFDTNEAVKVASEKFNSSRVSSSTTTTSSTPVVETPVNNPATSNSDGSAPTTTVQPDTLPPSPITSSSHLKIPPPIPEAAVVTTLYPQLLVIAFRLLKRNFPASPLVSQFHTTIKSQGRTSTVLAASTELYNELISAEWEIYKNIPGVYSLLKEMETLGVDPDWKTFHFLQAIGRRRNIDRKKHLISAKRGDGASTPYGIWWDLPPNKEAMKLLLGPEGWLARFKRSQRQRGGTDGQELHDDGFEVDEEEEEEEEEAREVEEDAGGDEVDARYGVKDSG